ncbi:hypothetical protein PV325_010293 [Microctonus aethiopoides]|nr:hypothetical protein PV325_010293 [Microctonus aethiopoides]
MRSLHQQHQYTMNYIHTHHPRSLTLKSCRNFLQNVEKAKKITNRDIITAHANATGKESRNDNHTINNPSVRPVQGNSENSCDSNHNKSVELNNLIPQNNSAKIREELEAKLKKAEDVKYWQNKYEELRNSNSFHLTDKTGRQFLGVLNNISSRLKTGDAMNGLIPNSQTEEETVGLTKGSNICIGSKIWLPKLIYDTIMNEKERSAFRTNSSYALWKPKILATCVVREHRNVDHRMSRKNLNKLFNGAITAARKRTKKLHTDSDENSSENDEKTRKW